MRILITLTVMNLAYFTACTQTDKNENGTRAERIAGGNCENCEAALEYGNERLTWIDTLPDFTEPGPKLEVSGTVFHKDGKTPARGIILYIYHTDQKGEYPTTGSESGWAERHGYLRGWIKTNADGKYRFYTLRPAPYPGGGNPAHIHAIIKEPGMAAYWIDEYLFDGGPYLTQKIRRSQQRRGGNGILKTKKEKNGVLIAERNIILGSNVPGYK